MNQPQTLLAGLCLISLAAITGCSKPPRKEVIQVSPDHIAPIVRTLGEIIWEQKVGSPSFVVYVQPRTCKEQTYPASNGPSGFVTLAPPKDGSVTCTLTSQDDQNFTYYIDFMAPADRPLPPQGPFTQIIGRCTKC